MAATVPNLWPEEITVSVLSPATVLRAQAAHLTEQTKGILEGEVVSDLANGVWTHQLVLVAPVLDMYRHNLLTASHNEQFVYPVTVESPYPKAKDTEGRFLPPMPALPESIKRTPYQPPTANTDAEFLQMVGRVLRCGDVKSLMLSLIARSNDVANDDQNAEKPPESQKL